MTNFQREARDTLVPLPTAGPVRHLQDIGPLALRGRVEFLSLEYEDYDGPLVNWMAAVDWRFARNWGAGIGYRYVDYNLEVAKSDFRGELSYTFKGPTLFVNAAF